MFIRANCKLRRLCRQSTFAAAGAVTITAKSNFVKGVALLRCTPFTKPVFNAARVVKAAQFFYQSLLSKPISGIT